MQGTDISYSQLTDEEQNSVELRETVTASATAVVATTQQNTMPRMGDKKSKIRNLISFWIFGLCNNFAYVVMLSAAHDILGDESNTTNSTSLSNSTSNATTTNHSTTTVASSTLSTEAPDSDYLQCNPTGTGAILLADILPTLIIKSTVPLYIQRVPYNVKIGMIVIFAIGSFIIVALAHEIWLSIIGVVCASITGGLGEITFLSLSTFYDKNVVSTWSSGTGGAGVFGALAYAGFTTAGVSPRTTLLIMIIIPVVMLVTYIFVLTSPLQSDKKKTDVDENLTESLLSGEDVENRVEPTLTFRQKLKLIPPLFKYMIPLTVVYFGEYFINQGLHELLYFNGQWLTKKEQYRWYQVDYQIGVFISRSSVNLVHIRRLWILPVLQTINMMLFIFQVFYRFIPSIWIVFALILWEGLLGGAAYVNTFYQMSKELPANVKEYSIGVATLGDSVGIAIAGAVAVPVHDHICGMRLKIQ